MQFSKNGVNFTPSTNKPNLPGGEQTLTPAQYNNDQKFLSVKKFIINLFPNFANALITKVTSQVVAGTFYRIWFTLNNDKYEIKVFVPLDFTNSLPSLEYFLKNGVNFTPSSPSKPNLTGG